MVNKTLSTDLLTEALSGIIEAGVESLPYEAVGLLCPDGTVIYLTNELDETGGYYVSGSQLEAAFCQPDGVFDLGFDLSEIIIWHTHPSGFVGPSKGDLKSRRQPILEDIAHLVIALPKGETAYY